METLGDRLREHYGRNKDAWRLGLGLLCAGTVLGLYDVANNKILPGGRSGPERTVRAASRPAPPPAPANTSYTPRPLFGDPFAASSGSAVLEVKAHGDGPGGYYVTPTPEQIAWQRQMELVNGTALTGAATGTSSVYRDQARAVITGETSEYMGGGAAEADQQTVYVTDTGNVRHSSGCRHLRHSANPMSRGAAKAQGYGACYHCGG